MWDSRRDSGQLLSSLLSVTLAVIRTARAVFLHGHEQERDLPHGAR